MTYKYETVTEAVNELAKRGYTHNFGIKDGDVYSGEKSLSLKPDEFEIDEVYRYEGDTDPADESIVYAISSVKHDVKGVLINGYGASSDPISSALIKKLSVHIHPEQHN